MGSRSKVMKLSETGLIAGRVYATVEAMRQGLVVVCKPTGAEVQLFTICAVTTAFGKCGEGGAASA